MRVFLWAAITLSIAGFASWGCRDLGGSLEITWVGLPPQTGTNSHYVGNRPPLTPSPLIKLPIGSIETRGWLATQLDLMRHGFTGRLAELSKFVKPESGWLTRAGKGWEEVPYWLKGYGDLGYVLKDEVLIAEARRWLEEALESQQEDGFFGPPENRSQKDLWPNMIMLFAFQSFYEATGDERVVPFMRRYFRYQANLPEEDLLPGSWQKLRGGDNLESVYWLYNRTGDGFLLDLGHKVFRRTSDWTSPILTPERDARPEPSSFYHGVNIAMGIRQPGVYYQQAKERRYLEAVEDNYRQIMDAYGQQPAGLFGADENIRPGHGDPRQAAETCTMVELMYSHESLMKIAGETRHADRCEDIAFNALPAAMTPDLKGLHYLTAANLISCDSSDEHDFENSGTLVSYDPWSYRCCQHNAGFGWPYFAEHLWCATLDNGLAATLYAPCQLTARVAGGDEVRITERTEYPFRQEIELLVAADRDVRFPLYLRRPGWSTGVRLFLNGERVDVPGPAAGYLRICRVWKDGDEVRLELPAKIEVVTWKGLGDAVSVRRGPLWYSLRIGEEWKRYGGTDAWPAYEVLPTSDWNYGLLYDPADPAGTIALFREVSVPAQPFTPEGAPIVLRARAAKIPGWVAEGRMVGKVPSSPVHVDEPEENIELIPMGCARLRLSVFPVIKR